MNQKTSRGSFYKWGDGRGYASILDCGAESIEFPEGGKQVVITFGGRRPARGDYTITADGITDHRDKWRDKG